MLPYKDYSGMMLPGVFLSKNNEKTFQYDESLPSLPVPSLAHSLYRYLDSVRPLVSENEYKKTEALAKDFAAGIGKELHKKLMEKSNHVRNWLETWWEQYAYLITRTPHAPYMVMAGPGPYNVDIWPPKEGSQIERISLLIWTGMKYWQNLRRERLAIDRGSKTIVWTMHQYRRMFNCCKIPGLNLDSLKPYFKTESEGPCPSHILIMVNGRIFSLDACDASGEPFTPPVFERVLSQIKQEAYSGGKAGPGLSSLTALPREPWFELREHLLGLHADNVKLLEHLQSAVFNVALDERCPADQTEAVRMAFLDDCTDRWFDKSYSSIVYRNGLVACACDHSGFDGFLYIMKQNFCHQSLFIEKQLPLLEGSKDTSNLPNYQELKFVIDDKILNGIQQAKRVFQKNGSNVDLLYYEFKDFGKDLFRNYKLHPDTYMQMALQLAYYRLYKKGAATYETAVTRQFYHGRTETLRVCTQEVVDMCRVMLDPWASAKEKKEKLSFAAEKHLRLMQEAINNSGCDRHLMGLQLIAFEEGIDRHELFTDPSWVKSGGDGNYILSTSFLGFTPATGLVVPMCANGYGFFYSIIDNQIQFFSSCWKSDKDNSCRKLTEAVCQSLRDIKQVLVDTSSLPKL